MSDGSALSLAQLTDYHAKYFAYELTRRSKLRASNGTMRKAAIRGRGFLTTVRRNTAT